MKRIIIILAGICCAFTAAAQTDSIKKPAVDTLHVGNMIIVRDGEPENKQAKETRIFHRRSYHPSAISTNWWIIDLGFANYTDRTNYASAEAQAFAPGSNSDWFNLRAGKSVNINIWAFMQRLNLIKNVVNLKYGLGVELNNYRYKAPLKYAKEPTQISYDQSTTYKKDKLAADYVTVPMLLNFNFTPSRKNGFGFSAGISGGYLYSSRQKTITAANGKHKEHDDFNLRRWKLSYIGELQLGPVKLYGSLATQSMFEKGLDQTPYNLGVRLSNW